MPDSIINSDKALCDAASFYSTYPVRFFGGLCSPLEKGNLAQHNCEKLGIFISADQTEHRGTWHGWGHTRLHGWEPVKNMSETLPIPEPTGRYCCSAFERCLLLCGLPQRQNYLHGPCQVSFPWEVRVDLLSLENIVCAQKPTACSPDIQSLPGTPEMAF